MWWAPAILLSAALPRVSTAQAAGQVTQAATQNLLEKAHSLEVRGRLDLASQTWEQVLLTDPNNTEALGGMARAAKSAGNATLYSTYLERLRAINPNDAGIGRAERMNTAASNNAQLQQAGRLARQGQYGQAMNIYRQIFGTNPPPGDMALAYYETESATEEGRAQAISGLRDLAQKYPTDSRYQIALGRILTYNPKTRADGRRLLEAHPNDPQASEALRQSLLWDAQNPATAGEIRDYLVKHPDAALATVLRNEPKTASGGAITAAQRANAAVNATRTAEDRDAYRSLNQKHLEDAEAKFKAILAKNPDDANALAGMGYLRMQQANFGGAISFLVQAKSDGTRDPGVEGALATSRFWYTMGEGSLALGANDLASAEREYRAALQMRPTSVEALEGLGGTLLKAQQPGAAAPVFQQFVKLKPGAPHAWRGLFLAQFGAGNANLAIASERGMPAAVRSALASDPLYLQTLASAYSSIGRDADAQRVLRTALDLPFPAGAEGIETDTKLQYAGLLQQANHLDQAAGLYRQVLVKEPGNVAAYQGLIRAQHAAGRDEEAVQTIEAMPAELYATAMRDSGFNETVASIYQAQNRLDVAQDILEKSIQQQTTQGGRPSAAIQIQLAGIYSQRAEPAEAFTLFQEVLTQHPEDLNAWKGLIGALHATGRDLEALAQVQRIPASVRTELEGDVVFLQSVGAIYNSLRQYKEAQVFLRRVQEHYAEQHATPPADIEVQDAWLLYNSMDDAGLWRQLMMLGERSDLTDPERRTVQTIWASFAVRRANQASVAGNTTGSLSILNATARSFPDNPGVLKALAGGYAQAGLTRQSVGIWKSLNLTTGSADDYRSAVGVALAAQDTKDAETWLRFGLNQYPDDPGLLVLGARFEEQRGDINRAATYYHDAIKKMPNDDTGASLASELRQAAPITGSAGGASSGTVGDLSALLAPGAARTSERGTSAKASRPYVPGESSGVVVPTAPDMPLPEAGRQDTPGYTANPLGARSRRDAKQPRLKDYVPQAFVAEPGPASRLRYASLPSNNFEQRPISKLAEKVRTCHFVLSARPCDTGQGAERATDWTIRMASYHPPQQAQQAQPLTTQPTSQVANGSNGEVYGPYVPYVPPSAANAAAAGANRAKTQTAQPLIAQPQVRDPGTSRPLTNRPAGQAPGATQSAKTATVNSVVYGPYVPYVPAPAAAARQPTAPSPSMVRQPESSGASSARTYPPLPKPRAYTRTDAADERAAASARRKAAADAAAVTGVSKPPQEDYSTAPLEPASKTLPPSSPTTVYTKPAQYSAVPATAPPQEPGQNSTQNAAPTTNSPPTSDSYGQQYPQPRTGGTAPARNRAVRREGAAAPSPQRVERTPSLSYPGVGSPLGYQPYPVIGPAYPLPTAPTDYDLMQKQVPPLRGGMYTGELLAPQVPMTERQRAERDLAALEASYSGWVGGTGVARYRSGTIGYDRLTDLETTFEASYVAANSVRFTVVPKAVFLNSGQLDITNYTGVTGSPVIGTFNTANAVYNPAEQSSSGVGGELQVTAKSFAAAAGYTPYQFLVQNFTGRLLVRPNNRFTLFASRDAVTETQLSYAGLRDPGTATAVFPGNIWGGVVFTGGGVRFDMGNQKAGFYVTGDGADLTGYHVLENRKFEGSMGTYFLAHTFPGYGRLNVGVSMFGMHYGYNERQLSYGLGGYFSPNAYFLASVPVTFAGKYGNNFHYTINGAVGVQTFQEDSQLYFPLDRGIQTGFQTSLNCVTAQIANHTCGQYPTNSNTGGNYSANAEGVYRVADHWFAGGFLSANNTNNYNTVTAGFFVRYLIRPQIVLEDTPTGLFPVEGFRPLRVP